MTLLDELAQGLEEAIFGELLGGEGDSLGCQVANSSVEDLEGEEFLDEGVVFQEGSLEGVGHGVFVDEASLAGEVLIDDGEDGEDVLLAGVVLEELVVDAEDCEQELPGEGEVELGVVPDELGDQGQYVEHA